MSLVYRFLDHCLVTSYYSPSITTRTLGNFSYLCEERHLEDAIDVMEQRAIRISRNNAYFLLEECIRRKELNCARRLQILILHSRLETVTVLSDLFIRLFATCGSLPEANQAFDRASQISLYTWTAIISAHFKLGQAERAFELYSRMQFSEVNVNKYVYLAILKTCTMLSALYLGRLIHQQIIDIGLHSDAFIVSSLIDMYAKCRSLKEAWNIFIELSDKNLVSWNAMISGYAQQGEGFLAVYYFKDMQYEGIEPDRVTFISTVRACGSIGAIRLGRYIHQQIIARELHRDTIVGNSLVDMYARCMSLKEACNVFESLPNWDVVSWNAMISGYIQHNKVVLALDCFTKMCYNGTSPDSITFSSILRACGSTAATEHGRCIHEKVLESDFQSDLFVGSSLVDMYAKCGSLDEAHRIFIRLKNRNVVSWSAMIAAYVQRNEGNAAFTCFDSMQLESIKPDNVTFSTILKACGSTRAIAQGRHVHEHIIVRGSGDSLLGSTLVYMYTKCGSMKEAKNVFNKLSSPNIVVWDEMISGYAQNGESLLAMECFNNMQENGISPDPITYVSILQASGAVGAIQQGRCLHEHMIHRTFLDVFVGSSLVDMYVKCGNMVEAEEAFHTLPSQNVVSWGAMISGYAQHGNVTLGLQCFEDMQHSGIEPDDATFIGILTACSRAGLVDEGRDYFQSMMKCHKLAVKNVHYNCMIDLLGRAGCFKEAEDLVYISLQPNLSGWMTLLNACRLHGNVDLGKKCFNKILHLSPHIAASHVAMASNHSKVCTKKMKRKIQGLQNTEG